MSDYKSKYTLMWQDEFDRDGPPNPQKWSAQVGGHGWGNNELQYYTESGNAWVENGKLIIEARVEADKAEQHGGKTITSARIRSAGKGDWQYGLIEICAKIPKGLGTWPAIWMMPTDMGGKGWPACGEIDIMEHVGFKPEEIWATVHTGAYNHMIGTQKGDIRKFEGVNDQFHVYSVEWTPEKLTFRVDAEEIFVYSPKEFLPEGTPVTDAEWPFNKPFHVIMNIAFGGNLGGAKGIDMDVLPVCMEIDYVRVYQ